MRKLKYWFKCRVQGKHTINYYTDRCIICGKKVRRKRSG